MNSYFTIKHYLKQVRWRIRRMKTAVQFGPKVLNRSPIVFGNAMPKSGSHLLTQILNGLAALGPFVDTGFPPVNRDEGNRPLSSDAVIRNLQNMKPGDIRYGYIHATALYLSLLTQPENATIFVYRDPRDMLVSHVFYAVDMNPDHGMHHHYTENLKTMEERINAAIQGVTEPGSELASVKQRYDSYLNWLDQSEVLSVRFEDLIQKREAALNRILDHLEAHGAFIKHPREKAISCLKNAITPGKSGTFRKGIPGEWRTHFTESNKALFKRVAGDLLVELGYENSGDW